MPRRYCSGGSVLLATRLTGLLLALPTLSGAAQQPADIVFTNGNVYTVDAARTWASAVAVSANRIVYVGTDAGAQPFIAPKSRALLQFNCHSLVSGLACIGERMGAAGAGDVEGVAGLLLHLFLAARIDVPDS